jgi:hypothetical protein
MRDQTSLTVTGREPSRIERHRASDTSGAVATATAPLKHTYTPAVTLPEYLGRAVDFEWFIQPRPRLNSKTGQGTSTPSAKAQLVPSTTQEPIDPANLPACEPL